MRADGSLVARGRASSARVRHRRRRERHRAGAAENRRARAIRRDRDEAHERQRRLRPRCVSRRHVVVLRGLERESVVATVRAGDRRRGTTARRRRGGGDARRDGCVENRGGEGALETNGSTRDARESEEGGVRVHRAGDK